MKLFTTSIRNLYKFKLYTIINILGLSISLACVIMIMRFVHQETTVNHFATDLDRTYIMTIEEEMGHTLFGGSENWSYEKGLTSPINDEAVEVFTSFVPFEEDYITSNNIQYKTKLIGTDSNFFKILPYPMLYGSNLTDTPNETILTSEFAIKLFGNDDPIGKTITLSTGDILRVIGVIGDPLSKSFLEFDLIVNQKLQPMGWSRMKQNLVMLNKSNNVDRINKIHSSFFELSAFRNNIRFQLTPLKDFYFESSSISLSPILIQGNRECHKQRASDRYIC